MENQQIKANIIPGYYGEETYTLDDKSRSNIPAQFRKAMANRNKVLLLHPDVKVSEDAISYLDDVIFTFSESVKGKKSKHEIVNSLDLEDVNSHVFFCRYGDEYIIQGYVDTFFNHKLNYTVISDPKFDDQGRARIPDAVKEGLGLEDKITYVGKGDYIVLRKP